MRLAFYISGKSGRLYKFLEQTEKIKSIDIVISDKSISDDLEMRLNKLNINYCVVDYKSLIGNTNKEKNLQLSNEILRILEENKIDYCFSFGSHLLSGALLDVYKWKLINFHPAILPMYPGRKSIDQAVEHGNTFLVGNTAHFIDEGMDTGKIIMQSVIPIQQFYDTNNDYNCVLDIQIEMLEKIISLLEEDRILVNNDTVRIAGADYSEYSIYPSI